MKIVQVSGNYQFKMVTLEIHSESLMKLLEGIDKDAETAVGREFLNAIYQWQKANNPVQDVKENAVKEVAEENGTTNELVSQES